jgi:hypothetical protein
LNSILHCLDYDPAHIFAAAIWRRPSGLDAAIAFQGLLMNRLRLPILKAGKETNGLSLQMPLPAESGLCS